MNNNITINILTRTSNRPNGFRQCYESVNRQTYTHIKHYVSYDNEKTFSYLEDFNIIPVKVSVKKKDKPKVDAQGNLYAPYNLYCNELLDKVEDGWVIFLDDDDRLFNDNVLYGIAKLISNCSKNTLIIGRMRYPNGKLIPSRESIEAEIIKQNDIGSPCVVFHSKFKNSACWDDYKRSDFRFIKQLESIIPHTIYTTKIFTQINNFGDFGRKTDINLKLPRSFYKSKMTYNLIPKYHVRLGNMYIFHPETYKRFFKKLILKFKTLLKF
jgi:hypothetical protein